MSNRKTYSKEFKEEAVRLAQQNGNVTETARNLGLQQSVLRRWKEGGPPMLRMGRSIPGKGHSVDEELRQLQRDKQRLKETVEILEPMLPS